MVDNKRNKTNVSETKVLNSVNILSGFSLFSFHKERLLKRFFVMCKCKERDVLWNKSDFFVIR